MTKKRVKRFIKLIDYIIFLFLSHYTFHRFIIEVYADYRKLTSLLKKWFRLRLRLSSMRFYESYEGPHCIFVFCHKIDKGEDC